MYGAIGGADGCHKLAAALYARVNSEPLLRPLFPGKNHHCAIEEFAAFLVQFLGGPAGESQRRWWLSLRESHARFKLDAAQREAWLRCMSDALEEVGIEASARTSLRQFFEESSGYIVDTESEKCQGELAQRWQVQKSLDDIVEAIRTGDAKGALPLPEGTSPSVVVGLLAEMIRSRDPRFIQYLRERVSSEPSLLHERYASSTLLHKAAAAGGANLVQLFLKLGANPNVRDGGGHTPLYSLANECGFPGSEVIARILVSAGAGVDIDDGVKRCTPLHLAARRGNAAIAAALLDVGANIEARDSLGHTPLRRAVNCNKAGVAALLLSRGADAHSRCKKGVSPLQAARTPAMQRLLTGEASQAPA